MRKLQWYNGVLNFQGVGVGVDEGVGVSIGVDVVNV